MLLAAVIQVVALAGCTGESKSDPPPKPNREPNTTVEPWITEVTAGSGLEFQCRSFAAGELYLPEIMGGGIAVFDANGDGRLDVLVSSGNRSLTSNRSPAGFGLFLQTGPFQFRDATAESGFGDPGYGIALATGDYDNDGDVDVYASNLGADRLFRNDGQGRFTDVTTAAGITIDQFGASAAFFDYDHDGHLDLYVTQYVAFDPKIKCADEAGRPEYCGPKSFPPLADVLLRNNGDGTFADVSESAGIGATRAAGLGVVCHDFNRDGWVDVYVANDAYANNLWVNQKNGTFVDEGLMQGVAYNLNGQAEAGMGVVASDFDSDGWPDLFMTHLVRESNTFYRNLGAGRGFVDDTGQMGLAASSMTFTGFGTLAIDIDLDGDRDLAVANGRVTRGPAQAGVPEPWTHYAEENLFYLYGAGRFELARERFAPFTTRVESSRGLASGDFDDDGDLDFVLTSLDAPVRIYRNDVPRSGKWLAITARDARHNRDAIDAVVTVIAGDRRFTDVVSTARGYASSSAAECHFGLGAIETFDAVEVQWPGGATERFPGGEPNRRLQLVRGRGEAVQ
ncbi:MAG: CRTAC1 family protein [Planctomycetota bacterium]